MLREVDLEALEWRGFKERILKYDVDDSSGETGLNIVYKKTFKLNNKVRIEMLSNKRYIAEKFEDCKTLQDFVNEGIDKDLLEEIYNGYDFNKNLTKAKMRNLEIVDDIWAVDEDEEIWDTSHNKLGEFPWMRPII